MQAEIQGASSTVRSDWSITVCTESLTTHMWLLKCFWGHCSPGQQLQKALQMDVVLGVAVLVPWSRQPQPSVRLEAAEPQPLLPAHV